MQRRRRRHRQCPRIGVRRDFALLLRLADAALESVIEPVQAAREQRADARLFQRFRCRGADRKAAASLAGAGEVQIQRMLVDRG